MYITVILCTYNRCRSLAKALESASAIRLPESIEWEVLVVDNNSRDQTRETVKKFCDRHPGRFRYLFEPMQGKSHALNTGIREARGDVLAFMDDDVTVDSEWLLHLTAALHSGEWAGAGGRILPERTIPFPRWLLPEGPHTAAPLALFDRGLQAGPLTESPFGTNMAFQKKMFEKYGMFRIDLGPRPGSEIRSEESEFASRLLAGGERLRYEPSAVVYHEMSPARLQQRYFLRWWFDKARAKILVSGVPLDTRFFIAGVPLYLFRRLGMWAVRWITSIDPSVRFESKVSLWGVAGEIVECYRLSHEQERQKPVESR